MQGIHVVWPQRPTSTRERYDILEKDETWFYITLEKIKHGANIMIKCLGKYKIRKINIIIER